MATMFARHSLVWLSAPGWQAARAAAVAAGHAEALERWRDADWPLVARRHDPDADVDQVCLGLPSPPDPASGARRRFALRVPADYVARSAPPLPLKAALASLPQPWGGALARLRDASVGLELRVYGSAAMQALTGLAYLRPGSDIDLLLYPATAQQLRAGLALLERFDAAPALDGEIVFPNGAAVAWREWRAAEAGHARVLVKAADAVRLSSTNALLATLRAP
ncbi:MULTISPECIES: malonate decarboxylase holo-[acyl-carrier-protein] synthase [unclassified Janthinobacterium]|uniref:malonate decarboxylase holo-[acyl-carrier-protein] synthase n=1 Tax=unclassified Janthinobacterium TaxID=2610881 RepID=UPI0003457CE7|nr:MULTISPECIES: malonate decarboxylase holo-[acyl-carrier-protein] synthase [unclassified Janthinobacterium]MEC5160492.1 phosphoribosyl-dephospho-CoA transferase [Janthinobacterium sp. CG_S6]